LSGAAVPPAAAGFAIHSVSGVRFQVPGLRVQIQERTPDTLDPRRDTALFSSLGLCLGRRLLLGRDRSLTRTLAGARVGVRSLSADRQVAAMPESAIGADFDEPLDVHRNLLAEIALHHPLLLDHGANAVHFLFAEVLHLLHGVHLGLIKNGSGARMPDAVDIGQPDVDVLLAR